MRKTSIELIVGLFCLLGLICVSYLTIKLGKMELFSSDTYEVEAHFPTASGLRKGSQVLIAGVEVGKVDSINLLMNDGSAKANVSLSIKKGIAIDVDTIASIKRSGIVGDMFIRLSPGGNDELIKPGGRITETEPAIDLEELVGKYIFGNVKK